MNAAAQNVATIQPVGNSRACTQRCAASWSQSRSAALDGEFSSIPEQWRKKWRQDRDQRPLKLHGCLLTPVTCSQRSSLDLRSSAVQNEAFFSIVGVKSPEQCWAGRAEQRHHSAGMKVHDNEDRSERNAPNMSEGIAAALQSAFVLQKRLF